MNKIISVFLLAVLPVAFCGGCGWMGRTAGKAQAKLERKAESVQDGYEEGYEQEKAKQRKSN